MPIVLHIVLNSDLKKTNIGQNTIMKITYGIKTDKNDNQYTKKCKNAKKKWDNPCFKVTDFVSPCAVRYYRKLFWYFVANQR